eukprot:768279-Hanusia_phi.AAC.2
MEFRYIDGIVHFGSCQAGIVVLSVTVEGIALAESLPGLYQHQPSKTSDTAHNKLVLKSVKPKMKAKNT